MYLIYIGHPVVPASISCVSHFQIIWILLAHFSNFHNKENLKNGPNHIGICFLKVKYSPQCILQNDVSKIVIDFWSECIYKEIEFGFREVAEHCCL